jgi:diguanylate cyclase (GGDEF)-like protein/PAS domain S-box-containing protein
MDGAKKSDALWDWNLVTNRVHFSPRWVALMGADDDEVSSSPQEWFLRVHPEDNAQVSRELESARNGGAHAFEFRHRMRHKNGSYRWMACSGVVVRDDAGQAIRLTGSHADVIADAAVDRLTGLPSRVLFVERLTRALDRYSRYGNLPFAVLLLGLDRSPGPASHPYAGVDAPLLTTVARRLETCLRIRSEAISKSHDHLVARLEDDYFAILLEGLGEIGDSQVLAERILAELQSPITLGTRQVYVSASIGVAVSVTGYTSAETVLSDAETALYRARVLGGSRSEVFDTAVLRSEQAAVRLESDMTSALDREEFAVVYQPIVSLESYRIVGFEALVRWHHPTVGLIAPSEFIPVAERTGFIVPLGAWVLRRACAQLNAWREAIPAATDLWMSVNLSTVQLKRSTVVDEIGAILRECHVNPQAVVLELTEGVACENPAAVKTVLMHGYSHQHRRLRHWLLVALLLASASGGYAEGRPLVRAWHEDARRERRHHRYGDPHGARTGVTCRRRGHRTRRTGGVAPVSSLRVRTGLFVRTTTRCGCRDGDTEDRRHAAAGRRDCARCRGAGVLASGKNGGRKLRCQKTMDGHCCGGGNSGGIGRRCAPIRSGLAISRQTRRPRASPGEAHVICIPETGHPEHAAIQTT